MLRISKAVQGGFALIFLLVMISAVVRGCIKYSPAAIAFTVVCGMVFTAGVILIYGFLKKKTVRLTRKQIDKIFIVIAAAVLVLQLISAFYLKFIPVSDLGYVDRAARDFCLTWDKSDLYNNLPERHMDYFVRYPNNQALLVILSLVYSLCRNVSGVMPLAAPILLNTIGLNVSFIFLYLISKKISRDKFTPLLCAVIGAGFSVFYTYTPYFYTDSMSMPWVMASIYMFLSGMENKSVKKSVVQLLFSGLFLVIGCKIKGSVIILIPAFLLYLIYFCTKLNRKAYFRSACVLLSGIVIASAASSAFIKSFDLADKQELEEIKFPPTHWVMMGLHDRGGFYLDDYWFTVNSGDYDQKKEANLNEIKKRISDYGLFGMMKHLAKKISWTWGDGTYFIGYYLGLDKKYGGEATMLKNFVTGNIVFKWYCSVYQFMLLAMITFSFAVGAFSGRTDGKEILLKIIICGVFVFFVIWETRSRYLVNFSPLFIMASASSIKAAYAVLIRRFSDHKTIEIRRSLKNAV